MIKKLFSILSLCGCLLGATSCQYTTKTVSTGRDLAIADSMFTHILDKYNVEKYGLLQETYPATPGCCQEGLHFIRQQETRNI